MNFALVPVAWQVILFVKADYSFEPLVAILIAMALFFVWHRLPGWWAFVFALLCSLAMYALIDYYVFIFLLLILLSTIFINKPDYKYLSLVGVTLIAPIVWVVPYFTTSDFAYSHLFEKSTFSELYFFILYIVVSIIILRFSKIVSRKYEIALGVVSLVVILIGGSYLFVKQYDPREKQIILIDKAIKEQKWDEVLKVSERYSTPNLLITYAANLAYLNKGELPQKLLTHNQSFGKYGLFMGRNVKNRDSQYSDYIYASLGLYNEAHRLAWEAMTEMGLSVTTLKKLVAYNLIMGRSDIAQKFNSRLSRTLFYSHYYDEISGSIEK
ncbi:MAG: DUF6057 family protein, partial [Rikenellaceae bacterium]